MIKNWVSPFGITNKGKINPFFIYFSCWIIVTSLVLLLTSKYDSFIFVNHHRSFAADIFFTIFTELDNDIILIPLTILFLYKKNYRILVGLLASALINALITSWLKHSFNHPRPLACYGKDIVETARWITLYQKYSFPSGHTATAFYISAYLSLYFGNGKYYISLFSFIGACLTGYSRIYLGEHFLEDLWLGSIIGVIEAVVTFIAVQYIFDRIKKKKAGKEKE